jgi:hypothetical protein
LIARAACRPAKSKPHPSGEQRDLVWGVDHDPSDPRSNRIVQLTGGLRIAVQDDLRRRHFTGQDGGQFTS